jgi:hypothetical protein
MRPPSPQVRSEGIPRQEVKKERRLKANQSVSQPPESAIVQNVPEEEPMGAPSVASPGAEEKDLQQLARAPFFADRLQGGGGISSPSARELYYANKGQRADDAEEVSGLKDPKEVVQDFSQGQTRGIRYSFVRRAADGKDEAVDITKFSGKWSELQLTIESNVSGHLYVLTSFGKGKWQSVRPESSNVPRARDGAIQMKAYQSVNFALSQVTNALGKPVVSSITVLLSSTPLTDLGKWLGRGVGSEPSKGSLIENAATDNFVLDPFLEPGTPLRIKIVLEEE